MSRKAQLTHRDSTREAAFTNSNHHITADAFNDLASRNNKAIRMTCTRVLAVRRRKLFDHITFASHTGFVTFDIMAADENTVTRNNFTWF